LPKLIQILVSLALVVVVVIGGGGRWYYYVANTASPYDEVGITLNGFMPTALRKWGCDKMHATFGNVLPPLGCGASDDGKKWM